MGDNVLETQAKNTKKRRARQGVEQSQGKLFRRPDTVEEEFTVECNDSSGLGKVGEILLCFPGKGNAPIDVVRENKQIGVVNNNGGNVLLQRVKEAGCGSVVVENVCELTASMKVKVRRD